MSFEDILSGKQVEVNYQRSGPDGNSQTERVLINVRRGVHEGFGHRLSGMGHFPPPIQGVKTRNIPGDLIVSYVILKHDKFRKEDNNLFFEAEVPYDKMIFGTKILVETIDGRKTVLNIPAGTKSGKQFRFRNKGLPKIVENKNQFGLISTGEEVGDFYVVAQVVIPENLTQEQVEWLEKGRSLGIFEK